MSLRYTFLFWLSLQFLRGCDAVITDSEHSRNDLLRLRLFPRHRVRVIHCGRRFPIAGSNPTLAISAARPYLLYVGGFLRHKNVALLISAFEVLARELPHQLVLVGWATDSILRPLRELVRRHGLTDRVSFRQDLSDEELSVLYRDCELFVFPSRYEGFGFPVLEAMACGAPVLCSNSSSLPEIGGDAVEYFNPESGPEMVSAMRRLLGDPARRQELSAQGKTRSRLFAPERTAAAIGELADELLRAGNEVPVQRSRE
jgi:glycosyltransferase involved in cell wall biosynthesis